jgi:hypothetical protein
MIFIDQSRTQFELSNIFSAFSVEIYRFTGILLFKNHDENEKTKKNVLGPVNGPTYGFVKAGYQT